MVDLSNMNPKSNMNPTSSMNPKSNMNPKSLFWNLTLTINRWFLCLTLTLTLSTNELESRPLEERKTCSYHETLTTTIAVIHNPNPYPNRPLWSVSSKTFSAMLPAVKNCSIFAHIPWVRAISSLTCYTHSWLYQVLHVTPIDTITVKLRIRVRAKKLRNSISRCGHNIQSLGLKSNHSVVTAWSHSAA